MIAGLTVALLAQKPQFALHNNDRVAFYGDSITDNNPWTYYIADWVTERFPNLNIYFVNAGVGGDRVTGGWMGPVDQRLTRDLFSRKPTVVTIMLGMNDAGYQPYNQGLFDTYKAGYRHILDRIEHEAHAKVWLFEPTPYDDITRAPGWTDGGYSGVLRKYSDFVVKLAKERNCGVVDQTDPMDDLLTKANAANPKLASQLVPDRIHPNWAAELVMAKDVLKAWGGTPIVSSTTIDWTTGDHQCVGSAVSDYKQGSFVLKEDALPFWINRSDPMAQLVLDSSNFDQKINQETLTVNNMPAGSYTLAIDGKAVGNFTADQFSAGIQLETLNTPMNAQAQLVQNDINSCLQLRYNTWRQIDYGMQTLNNRAKNDALQGLAKLEDYWYQQARKDAKTVPHTFTITPQS